MTIRRGDYVRVVGDHPFAGKSGFVMEIMRADRYMERRARVQLSSAHKPIIAMRYLVEDPPSQREDH